MSVDVSLGEIRIKEWPTINLSGGVDFDLDNIRLKEFAPVPVNLGITQLPEIKLKANLAVEQLPRLYLETQNSLQTDNKLVTDNKVDLALEVRVPELPRLDVQLGFRSMRFHFPLSYRFSLTLFGFNILTFETCGEGMVVTEDYQTHQTEGCS